MPKFDKSTVDKESLCAEMYVNDKGHQTICFMVEKDCTSDYASQVNNLYATKQKLDELRHKDTLGMGKCKAKAHKKKL